MAGIVETEEPEPNSHQNDSIHQIVENVPKSNIIEPNMVQFDHLVQNQTNGEEIKEYLKWVQWFCFLLVCVQDDGLKKQVDETEAHLENILV